MPLSAEVQDSTERGYKFLLMQVDEVNGRDVICTVKNSSTLAGSLFTLHASQVHIDLPTLSEKDKEVISTWGAKNKIDFLSLSYTRHAEDVRQAREFLSKLGDLNQTQIFAKIENVESLATVKRRSLSEEASAGTHVCASPTAKANTLLAV
ncbi:hypothetical protein RIF29_28320 [Crotalaria pallida]|uniref:pyruvate kinase n=1 Tax=Crotalaria pallida TaxID=3830 RepID=A0AAN9EYC2_CROPI